MNNIKKNVGGAQIGDEDRIKNIVGKIDLLKLGHHGYQHSNTKDYLNVLMPEYVIITNDIRRIFLDTYQFLEKNKINYLYSTYDDYEVSAIITNDNIELGFGTKGIKKVKDKLYYISEENVYKNYLNYETKIKYNIIEKNVKNWEELKNIIENNKNNNIHINNNYNKNNNSEIYLFNDQFNNLNNNLNINKNNNFQNNNFIYNQNNNVNINDNYNENFILQNIF